MIGDLDTYLENDFFFLGKHVCGKVSTQNKENVLDLEIKIKLELNNFSSNLITNLVLDEI